MKYLFRPALVLAVTLAVSCADAGMPSIVPMPQDIRVSGRGSIKIDDLAAPVCADDTLALILPESLKGLTGSIPVELTCTGEMIHGSGEGYRLEIGEKAVTVSAGTRTGLYYGCITLAQVIEDAGRGRIPLMTITDWPANAVRGLLISLPHKFYKESYFYELVDRLAGYKVNTVFFEFHDKIRFEKHPELAMDQALTIGQFRALCEYAGRRGVRINPLVQGLGHVEYIVKRYPQLCESLDTGADLCPSDPATYDLIFDLYGEAMDAAPYSTYLHIGGDEVSRIGVDGRCRRRGMTAFELQMDWLRRVCDFAKAHGKVPVFWDDMPIKHAGMWPYVEHSDGLDPQRVEKEWNVEAIENQISLFPPECIYMRWKYNDILAPGHIRMLDWYRDHNLPVMAASSPTLAECYMPRQNSHIEAMRDFSRLVAERGLEGIITAQWGDGDPHLELVMRGFIGQAEFGWNPSGRAIADFDAAWARREFGIPASAWQPFITDLERCFDFYDLALAEPAEKGSLPSRILRGIPIDLPDKDHPGVWSTRYAGKIQEARVCDSLYREITNGIEADLRKAERGNYTLEMYKVNNEMAHFAPRMILALAAYDTAEGDPARTVALQEIRELCASQPLLEARVDAVYGKTMLTHLPEGYQQVQLFHPCAQTNDLGWMFMHARKLAEKIEIWEKEQ